MRTERDYLKWILPVSHLICHIYVVYISLPVLNSLLGIVFLVIAMLPAIFLVLVRLAVIGEKNRKEPVRYDYKSDDESSIELRSTEMDIEGPPRIPLRSAYCPEMAGILVSRLFATFFF